MLTVNVNSHGTLRAVVTAGSLQDADILLVQETRSRPSMWAQLRRFLARRGWITVPDPAHATLTDAAHGDPAHTSAHSGGTAILWRRHVSFCMLPKEIIPGRMMAGICIHPTWENFSWPRCMAPALAPSP